MKVTQLGILLAMMSVSAFAPLRQSSRQHSRIFSSASTTNLNMFGGAGAGMPSEDNAEELKKMEDAAKSMGMSVEEYQLGMRARTRLVEQLDQARVTGGNPDKVAVTRDGNNPPKELDITVTEAGKDLGQDSFSNELCAALKNASDESRKLRTQAQKDMMMFIQNEMKSMGKA